MKKTIIFVGAGAIGRGYLPWVIDNHAYNFVFVDINKTLVDGLNKQGEYKTYRTKGNKLEVRSVKVKKAYSLFDFPIHQYKDASAVFVSVSPRNIISASNCLKGVRCPVILCENDPRTVAHVKNNINYDKVYFGVPDVITSNSASPDLLKKDKLAIITEEGKLFIDEDAGVIKGTINYCSKEELDKQWTAKLYLHNTPHCIAAYLGAFMGAIYVHEAMAFPQIKKIVTGAMNEMLTALKLRWNIPHPFLDWYAEKELQRFSNVLLYDPIARVGREPIRKLDLGGRLVGAAQICVSLGFIPQNILTGIAGAILFENERDADRHLNFIRKNLSVNLLLTYVLGLRKGEALDIIMKERLPKIIRQLEQLVEDSRKISIHHE
ncbi:MAG: mannitol-1-phosphate 5-dehydrogenase [Candidatus Omnitrophica bacterium]|nr:mannitol-1-phosphate 5-dehydrogenase [Candidatus Omnitrophota bacterium]